MMGSIDAIPARPTSAGRGEAKQGPRMLDSLVSLLTFSFAFLSNTDMVQGHLVVLIFYTSL